MVATTYRYRWSSLSSVQLGRNIPGAVVIGATAPGIFVDVTVDSTALADLTDYMVSQGWVFSATSPTTTVETANATTAAAVRKLVDFIGAPSEGYTSGAYRVITMGAVAPSNITWWTDSGATVKIFEVNYTRNAAHCATTVQWKVYDAPGTTVLATVTDTISYSGIVETTRTRTIA